MSVSGLEVSPNYGRQRLRLGDGLVFNELSARTSAD